MAKDFISQAVSHSEEFLLEKDAATVFPLFTPEGEKLWAPGWSYTNLIGSAELKPDDVFLTDTHDHKSTQAIWIVSDYDANQHYVSYYKIEPEQKIGKITVQCFEQSPSATRVRVTYKYTSLSASGNQFVAGFTKEVFSEFIGTWRSLLRDYFGKQA